MSFNLADIQVPQDALLRAGLAQDEGVQRALSRWRTLASGYGFGARRSLLTGALRLTRTMAPTVADALRECCERIGFDQPVEVFVRPEPLFNAFCVKDARGLIVIGLSSHLLESFTPSELQFVIGHELGHAAYDHFEIPMPHIARMRDFAGRIVSQAAALDLFCWSRAAELSADRIGLICSRDPDAAATAFFKLASGIASPSIRADLDAFAAQVDSLASTPEARAHPRDEDDTLDCFATHPYSPVRVRALVAFAKSAKFASATRAEKGCGIADDELDAIIDRDLALMLPNYLHEQSVHAVLLRRALSAAGVLVAAASKEVDQREIDAMRAMLGEEAVPTENPRGDIDIEQVAREFCEQVDEITRCIPLADRARLTQHLTIIAAADGDVDDAEHARMAEIAVQLGVNPSVVDQTLAGAVRPLD